MISFSLPAGAVRAQSRADAVDRQVHQVRADDKEEKEREIIAANQRLIGLIEGKANQVLGDI